MTAWLRAITAPVVAVLAAGVAGTAARAQGTAARPASAAIYMRVDNDQMAAVPARDERGYTSGLAVSVLAPMAKDGLEARLLQRVCGSVGHCAPTAQQLARVVTLSQSLWTPANTATALRVPDDQPYAATLSVAIDWLAGGPWYRQAVGLELGVLGPAALGEATQNGLHRLLGQPQAQGWAWQVRAQPVVAVRGEGLQRASLGVSSLDAVLRTGCTLGTPVTECQLGGLLRMGQPPAEPTWPGTSGLLGAPGWMVFTGLQGRASARDERIGGATYGGEPSRIQREPWGGEFLLGAAWSRRAGPSVEFSVSWRSPEFTVSNTGQQPPVHRVGSLAVRWPI